MSGVSVAYQSDRVTLYHGDCRDAIALVKRASCGLIATDPPYGVRWQSGIRTNTLPEIAHDDGSIDVPAILGLWTGALMPYRHVYVFGFSPEQISGPMQLGGTCELIWDKEMLGIGNLSQPWGPQHERIAFGCFAPSKRKRANGSGQLTARLRRGSVISVPRKNSRATGRHQTEKPVELMAQLIESSTIRGDVVLDPFAGSGSTLVAAVLLGRRAIGVELDDRHVATAVDRIQRAESVADQMEAA